MSAPQAWGPCKQIIHSQYTAIHWIKPNTLVNTPITNNTLSKQTPARYEIMTFALFDLFFAHIMKVAKKKLCYPCGKCQKNCLNQCIECSNCETWFHRKCCNLSVDELTTLSDNLTSYCLKCTHSNDKYDFESGLTRLEKSARNGEKSFYLSRERLPSK